MIIGIDHAQLTIPTGSEELAREFYCGFLGLKEIEKPENLKKRGGFWLSVGNLQIHAGAEDGVDRLKTKAHIAYRVTGIEDWKSKLHQRGIEILDGLPIPGAERFEFRDPFGNRVEFIERIAARAKCDE